MKDICIAEPIGVCCVVKGSTRSGIGQLRLFFESGVDEGAYYPSQDIHVYGTQQILTLRNFCDKLLEACEDDEKGLQA